MTIRRPDILVRELLDQRGRSIQRPSSARPCASRRRRQAMALRASGQPAATPTIPTVRWLLLNAWSCRPPCSIDF